MQGTPVPVANACVDSVTPGMPVAVANARRDSITSGTPVPVANARMYAVTPACEADWNTLLRWALDRAGLAWPIVEHRAPAPMAALWSRDDLGAVLMCGLPYACRVPRPLLVAAPVPSPARYGGRPVYFTDIVVAAGSPHRTLRDTFGGFVGTTVADSLSGGVALQRHLDRHRVAGGALPYRGELDGLLNARGVIEAITAGRIDVGPLDSYSHDLLRLHAPELAAQVRAIDHTEARPIPSLVATADLPPGDLQRLRAALLSVGDAPELADVRARLLLLGFAVPDAPSYAALATLAPERARAR